MKLDGVNFNQWSSLDQQIIEAVRSGANTTSQIIEFVVNQYPGRWALVKDEHIQSCILRLINEGIYLKRGENLTIALIEPTQRQYTNNIKEKP